MEKHQFVNTSIAALFNRFRTGRSNTFKIRRTLGQRLCTLASIPIDCRAWKKDVVWTERRGAMKRQDVRRFDALNLSLQRIAFYQSQETIECTEEL